MIINGFLFETSFPGAGSVADLFHRCTFTCICWIVAREDPISEKSSIFTVGIMMQSTATKKGALWSLQVLFSIYIMSSFNYFAKFKSSLCVCYWNLKITILYHNLEWWNSPWILKTSYLKLEEENFKISREILKEAH